MDGIAGWSHRSCPERYRTIINKSLAQSPVSSDSTWADIIFIFPLKERMKKKRRKKKTNPDILRERSEASDGLILPVCVSAPQRGENVLLISRPPGEYTDLITTRLRGPATMLLAQDIA